MSFSDNVVKGSKSRATAYGDYYNATAKTPGASVGSGTSTGSSSSSNPLQTYGGTKNTPFDRTKNPYSFKKKDEETDEDPRKRALRRRLKGMKVK